MSDTRGWTRPAKGYYTKKISGTEYTISRYWDDWDNCSWCVWPYSNGNFFWEEAVSHNWLRLDLAKRAAHRHAGGKP